MAPTESLTKPKSRKSPHSLISFGKAGAAQKDHRKKIGFAPHNNCDPGIETPGTRIEPVHVTGVL